MEDKTGDGDLLAAYRRGDTGALERIVERYRRPLYAFILNTTAGADDADEIFQETWLRALRRIHLYRHRSLLSWLIRIARNLIIDRYRARKPLVSLEAENENDGAPIHRLADGLPSAADRAQMDDLRFRITAAVRRLPPEQREVFMMRTAAGLKFREIARLQKVSINTALGRMQYALDKMRSMLKTEYEELTAP